MRARARIEPESTRKTSIGEFPAYVVTYLDRSGRTPAYLRFAWVSMAGLTYQVVGLAPEKHQETMRDAAMTLRPLTEPERAAVTGKRLRILAAHGGELLDGLSSRSGNVWSTAYTALVNGLDSRPALKDGQLVKIVRLESIGGNAN
jgi:predicted Zn-dependent protease